MLTALVLLSAACGDGVARAQITAPFPLDLPAATRHSPPTTQCAPLVAPMVDMSGIGTFYKPTHSASIVDRAALARYSQRVLASGRFTRAMLFGQEAILLGSRDRMVMARCLQAEVTRWARAGAFLDKLDQNDPTGHRQAILVMLWSGIAASSAYMTAGAVTPPDAADQRVVQAWFARLSKAIAAEFTPPAHREPKLAWLDVPANHSHMGGAALGMFSVITQDRASLAAMKAELDRALAYADASGGLKNELGRGQRALQYQSFALMGIALMVELADANHIALSPEQETKLQAIVDFTERAHADPALLAQLTGVAQTSASDETAWMEIILPHLARHAPVLCMRVDAAAKAAGPARAQIIGMPVSLLFRRSPSPCRPASAPTS